MRGDTVKYLELLNESLSERSRILESELRDQKELNKILLKKLGIIESNTRQIEVDYNPVGGYMPLRQRIREKELESLEEAKRYADQERQAIQANAGSGAQ